MSSKPRQVSIAIPCPWCNQGIIINRYKTKHRKFLIGLPPIEMTQKCPSCGQDVEFQVSVKRSTKQQQNYVVCKYRGEGSTECAHPIIGNPHKANGPSCSMCKLFERKEEDAE